MSLNGHKAPKAGGGGDRVPQPTLEVGNYPARLAQIIDLGVQPQRAYKGEDKPPAHEVMFTYELSDAFMVDKDGNELEDKPRWISETFPFRNLEQDMAKSTKRYKALDPNEDFNGDFPSLIGRPCTVTITHGENRKDPTRPYENVGNVSPMRPRDAANAVELKNSPRVFVLDEPDMEIFHALPEWLQDKIKGNLRFIGSPLEEALKAPRNATESKVKTTPKVSSKKPVEKLTEAEYDNPENENEYDSSDNSGWA